MASKKKSFASKRSNLPKKRTVRRRRKRNAPRPEPLAQSNPESLTETGKEIMAFVAPAFVSYAAGRFAQRVAFQIGLRRFGGNEKLARLAALASNFAIAYGIHKAENKQVAVVAEHALPLQVGNGLAATQFAVQKALPKYGWIVSDFDEKQVRAQAKLPADKPSQEEIDMLEGVDEEVDYGIGTGIGMGTGIGAGAGALPPGEDDDFEDIFANTSTMGSLG